MKSPSSNLRQKERVLRAAPADLDQFQHAYVQAMYALLVTSVVVIRADTEPVPPYTQG